MRDADIRKALICKLSNKHGASARAQIIEELGVDHGGVRIDVAVIDDFMHGYEIKSNKDTLRRLSEQANAYSKVFTTVTIVVGDRHVDEVTNYIPDWWGILQATWIENRAAVNLRHRRRARINPTPESLLVARLLWRDEALAELERLGLDKGIRSKSRDELYQRLAIHVPSRDLQKIVSKRLVTRNDWRNSSSSSPTQEDHS
ncbi:MAG TPA: sce7726 family protein [Gammaproteobacteria bacterium]